MAKKKSKTPKKTTKPPSQRTPRADAPAGLPDRRAMEAMMRQMFGGLVGDRAAETPLDQAQDLVYEAFETPDPDERAALARKALEISPNCADAYVLLAEDTTSHREALDLYEKAVAAGERALGPDPFREDVGHFWGLLETRPYMRAREGLAHILWAMSRRDDAIDHLNDMLRLNPNDNQGLRYTLAAWLLAEDRDEELGRLLPQYDEDSAFWAYTRALFAFRRSGDTPEAAKLLKAARKSNKHVPAYLLGKKPMPPYRPESYSIGSQDEAVLYAAESLAAWKSTEGAIAWLKASEPKSRARKTPKPRTRGPLPIVKKRLEALPRELDVWQADVRPFDVRIEEAGELVVPWIALVTSRTSGMVMWQTITPDPPTADLLWDGLADAILEPMMTAPHRPTELQVRPDERWDELAPHLKEIGVKLVKKGELDHIDFLMAELKKGMSADSPPGLLEAPGVTPEVLAGFYSAAAEFYRRAPWRKLGMEVILRIDCDAIPGGPWYGVVMGQGGMTMGIALYDDVEILRDLMSGSSSDEENAEETVALSLTFDDDAGIPDADLDAIHEHGFEVAGSSAFPMLFRKELGDEIRPPEAWEIRLMEACLRAVPDFVATHRPDDPSTQEKTVQTASGPLAITLAWMPD